MRQRWRLLCSQPCVIPRPPPARRWLGFGQEVHTYLLVGWLLLGSGLGVFVQMQRLDSSSRQSGAQTTNDAILGFSKPSMFPAAFWKSCKPTCH